METVVIVVTGCKVVGAEFGIAELQQIAAACMLNAPPEKQQQHAHDCFSYYAWKNRNAILYIFYSFLKHLICNVYAGIISGLKRFSATFNLLTSHKKWLRIDDISDHVLMLSPRLTPCHMRRAGR